MVIEGGSGPSRRGVGAAHTRRGPRVEEPQTLLRLPEDPYAADFPKRPRRGRGALALAVVTVVVAAVIAISSSHSKKTDPAGQTAGVGGGVPQQPVSQTSTSGDASQGGDPTQQFTDTQFPAGKSNGVMVGYQDTQDGVEAAAANYVAGLGSEVFLHPDSRHKLIQTIADPAIEANLQNTLDDAFAKTVQGYGLDNKGNPPAGQTLVYRAVPIGVSVQSPFAKDKAVVSVWTDSIDGVAGTGSTNPVSNAWSTFTVTLTWVNGDWRLNSFTQADGPTPVSTQTASSSEDLQKAAKQFARLRYAP